MQKALKELYNETNVFADARMIKQGQDVSIDIKSLTQSDFLDIY